MKAYEGITERLGHMVAALGYYDEGNNAHLLTRAIERLVQFPSQDGLIALLQFRFYPALLVQYTAGIAALARRRYQNLAAIMRAPVLREGSRRSQEPAIFSVNAGAVFSSGTAKWVPRKAATREYTPASNYLLDAVRPFLGDYVPDEGEYEAMFDTYEYVLSLCYLDIKYEDPKTGLAPVGRFGWRGKHDWDQMPWAEFLTTGLAQGPEWEMLKAGFFAGSPERARLVCESHRAWLIEGTRGWS